MNSYINNVTASSANPYLGCQDYDYSNSDHSDPVESIRHLWSDAFYGSSYSRSTTPLAFPSLIKYSKEDLIKIATKILDEILTEKNYTNYTESQLTLAKCLAAAKLGRDKIPNGSQNKNYGNKPDAEIPAKRLAKHNETARKERNAIYSAIQSDLENRIVEILIDHPIFTPEDAERLEETYCKELVDIVLSRGNRAVGNCGIYALLVFYILKFIFKINNVYAVGVDRPGDHIFIIAGGQKPDAQGCFPMEWEKWAPHTLIVDIWIQKNKSVFGIKDNVFGVEEYETAWKRQLENWEKRGLLINNTILPTNWQEEINIYPKILVWDLTRGLFMERPLPRPPLDKNLLEIFGPDFFKRQSITS